MLTIMSNTVEINCVVFGDDPNHIFSVKILRMESVGALKEVIKDKRKPAFDHIPADNLALWKVSFPVDRSLRETLSNHNFLDEDLLLPLEDLSEVFSEAPIRKHLHIVVKVPPIVILPGLPSSVLQLFCYMRDDDYMHAFEVKIGIEESVSALKKAIKEEMKPDLDRVCADSLVLWHVNIPLDKHLKEVVEELGLIDEKALSPATRMSEIFPKQLDDGHIHVVFKNLPIARGKRMLSEPSENVFDRLKRAKIVTNAPSNTAKLEQYQLLQENPSERIYDDCPKPDADIPPIALLYEGFGHFLDIMKGRKDVPGLADVDVPKLETEVDALAKMIGHFGHEDKRGNEALPFLHRIFKARRGIEFPLLSPTSSGHNIDIHGTGAMIVGFKNSLAGINGLPHIELVCDAARLVATRKNEAKDQLYLRWRIPFVGLTIVGYEIKFYAIIAIDHRWRIIGLTPSFSCILSASDGRDRTSLYSAFTAASVLQAHIFQDTERHLKNPPAVIPIHARHFPAVSKLHKYPPSGGDYFSFEIQYLFHERQPYRYLYVAETPDKQLVLVKFTPQYSIELHEFCANSGHAPQILAFEELPGGWCAVAIEYIESGLPITDPSLPSTDRERWANELQCLVDGFHRKDLVHGDLRDANIICKGDSVMMIDFDWGGKDGEVFYPTQILNDELLQGRESDDLRITKEDDKRVLKNSLAKHQVVNIRG